MEPRRRRIYYYGRCRAEALAVTTLLWSVQRRDPSSSSITAACAFQQPALRPRPASPSPSGKIRRSSSVRLQARRREEDPEDSPASLLPFGFPSLDQRKTAPAPEANDEKLPFGFSFESAAALEQFLLDAAAPVEEALDALTGDWALSYADLSPDSTNTVTGQAFLATNAAYLVAGVYILFAGDIWFGFWTDIAAIASFNYHWNQLLVAGQDAKASAVRLALLLDYTAAAVSIVTATSYVLSFSIFPVQALAISAAGLVFLYMSWIWEYGRPYMLWHSLWHLCSAYSGYLIGTMHATGP